jgi:hypothetical protein
MTNGAQGLVHRIITVSLFKRFLATVMTAETKRGLRFHQKVFLIRTMGSVAGGTALWPYLMDYFSLIILLVMTLIASFIPLCSQQMTKLGGMGVMTLNAFPSFQSGVNIRLIHPYLIFTVAGITDFIAFFLEKHLGD